MSRPSTLCAFTSLILAGGVIVAAAAPPTRRQLVTILHTSDLHGHVLAVDDLREAPARGSLVQVATAVARLRQQLDHPVLLLDSGDALQGTPFEQLAHVRWGEASPTVDTMNRIGYQAMAVGNHEFNFGREVLDRARRQASFPFLSATIVEEATGEPAFTPYVVLQAGALRVGVLGLTTPAIPGWEYPEHYRGLRFEPPDRAARRWLPLLERLGCDLVVALAHTGFERDLSSGRQRPTAFEDFAWRLSQLDGIDVLLLGHTHEEVPPCRIGDTIVAQPGAHARVLTRLDLELEDSAGGWRVESFRGANLSMGSEVPDAGLTAELEPLHRRVVAALAGDVGEVTGPISVHGCRLADCAANDLIHAVQLEASGAELSLAGVLSDRTPDLAPGRVPRRWVDALYVYPNTLTVLRVTGAQVKDVLEHSARYHDGLDCSESGGCAVTVDRSIPPYNVDSLQGVSYRIDPTRREGERVLELRWHGEPLDPSRSFTLTCNSYRAVGGGGFPHLAGAEVVWRSTEELTELIAGFLDRHRPWQPGADGNWSLALPVGQEAALLSTAQ